jgi:CRP-like cAMP-binding protein
MNSVVVTRETISRIPLLADLPALLIEQLCQSSTLREFQRGAVLFTQGEKAEVVYAVLSGQFRLVQHTLEGQDVAMSVFASGDLIGMVAVVGDEEYPGSCESADDAVVLAMPGIVFRDMMRQHALIGVKMVQLLVQRLHEAHDHIRELAAERVERRLARTVLRLAKKVGVKTAQGIRLDMPLSRQDLAELCGTTLYTVSRILSKWQRDGLVELGRESVTLNHPHNLVLIAEDLLDSDLNTSR